MSKLSDQKEWLTLEETAKKLSERLNEPVGVTDVLRLGLDGHLKLSVNFINGTRALSGRVIPLSQATYEYEDAGDENNLSFYTDSCYIETYNHKTKTHGLKEFKYERQKILQEEYFNGTEVFRIDREITINRIWDIIITAGAETHLENKIQKIANGSSKKMTLANEVYVAGAQGEICQLLRYFLNKERSEKKADQKEPSLIIVNKEIEFERDHRREIANKLQLINNGLIEDRTQQASSDDYFPLGIEQDGGALVVRPSSITTFINNLKEKPGGKPLLTQGRREVELSKLIDKEGLDKLIPLGQIGVWKKLVALSNEFPYRDKKDNTVKGFFNKQNLISFINNKG